MNSSIEFRKEFTGKEFDDDGMDPSDPDSKGMGLYYFGARYYDPEVIRWISTDPAGQFFDTYAYSGNGFNPITAIDAEGLWQITIGGGFGIAAKVTFGKNNGNWNFGGGVGFGLGISGTYTSKNSDPNVPSTSTEKGGDKGAGSFGLEVSGTAGLTKQVSSVSGSVSLKAKGDASKTTAGAEVEVGVSVASQGTTGKGEAALSVDNKTGDAEADFSGSLDSPSSLGAMGFAGIVVGITPKKKEEKDKNNKGTTTNNKPESVEKKTE